MGAAIRPENDAERIRQNVAKMRAQGASDAEVEHYLTNVEGLKPSTAPKTQTRGLDPASAVGAALSGLAQGSTMGFADEILGGIDAADKYLHGDKNFRQNYEAMRDKVRAGDAAASEAHGKIHGVSEFVGGAAPFVAAAPERGLAALVKPSMGRLAGEGAAIGGVAGFGHASGTGAQQAEATAGGALIGAAAAPVLRGVATLGGKAVDAIGRSRVASAVPNSPLLTAGQQAKRAILQALAQGGKTLDDVSAEAALPVHQGQPTTIADLGGDAVTRVARGVQTKRSTSAAVRDAFERRQREQLGRIKQEGAETIGIAPGNMLQTAADKLTEAQTASRPLFQAFEASPAVDDPALSEMLQQPYFAKAYKQAKAQGQLTNRGPVKLLTTTTETKPFEMDGVPLLDADGNPKIPITTTTTEAKEVPTPFLLHRTKLNMDDFVNEGPSALPGAGGAGSSVKRDLVDAINRYKNQVATTYPGYRPALEAYAVPAGERSSLLQGMEAMRGEIRPPDIQFAASQADSRPFFQRGAWNELLQKAGSVSDRNGEAPKDVAHIFNGNPNVREALRHVFGDIGPAPTGSLGPAAPKGFQALENALSRESRYSRTASDILGGSPTMNKAEDLAGLANDGSSLPQSAMSLLQGSPQGVLSLLHGMAKRGQEEYADQVANALAPMVTAGIDNPAELRLLLSDLRQIAPSLTRRSTAADAIRQALQARLGGASGRLLSPVE